LGGETLSSMKTLSVCQHAQSFLISRIGSPENLVGRIACRFTNPITLRWRIHE
jgi:hypothetical protein